VTLRALAFKVKEIRAADFDGADGVIREIPRIDHQRVTG
jgi:hypothetical protein